VTLVPALSVLAHHSEPSDPVLLRWVLDTFEALLGYGPWAIVVPVGLVVVGFPVALALLALRARRAQRVANEVDSDRGKGTLRSRNRP
jgi:hypothetical protein